MILSIDKEKSKGLKVPFLATDKSYTQALIQLRKRPISNKNLYQYPHFGFLKRKK